MSPDAILSLVIRTVPAQGGAGWVWTLADPWRYNAGRRILIVRLVADKIWVVTDTIDGSTWSLSSIVHELIGRTDTYIRIAGLKFDKASAIDLIDVINKI